MKDHLLQVASGYPSAERRNLAREYLHVYILRLLHEIGGTAELSFVGGTALRLIHHLRRFSEDLDFSFQPSQMGRVLDVDDQLSKLLVGLKRAGYDVSVKKRTEASVKSGMFRFEGLPHAIGWSPDPRIALRVKLEIDTMPPAGAVIEATLVQKFFPVALRHHDLPSMFAGKLHAILTRPYAKGRDYYDLLWYLTLKGGIEPNLVMLENALLQTGHNSIDVAHWRAEVARKIGTLDWNEILEGLHPFLERPRDVDHMSRKLILKLLNDRPRRTR